MTIVPNERDFNTPLVGSPHTGATPLANDGLSYKIGKRAFDLLFSTIVLLPATLIVALALIVLNPLINKGPLIHVQKRMGRDCKPFRAYKFRTMVVQPRGMRGPDDPIEVERITVLGNLLRRSRFDELPQIWNVYRGEMSLIGPRPDYFRHACHYVRVIPGYRARYSVRPGISGLAQIKHGYAAGLQATRVKTSTDLNYIQYASLRLDFRIFCRTAVTVFRMRGA